MTSFTIYPAIDLRNGEVVRLRQGDPNRQKSYSSNPAKIAKKWQSEGAKWLHLVNLDGAFGENTEPNQRAIESILDACPKISTQLGGGIRSLTDIESALNLGVNRVILGTAILEDFSFAEKAIGEFGADRIAFGLDAQGGTLMVRGWQIASDRSLFELAEALVNIGATRIIYTDIATDGMGVGNDTENARKLALRTNMEIIASGGIASLDDVCKVKEAELGGVIIGWALYENQMSLKEALAC